MSGIAEFAKEQFAGVGPVQIRRMFGGAGIFCDGLMFALIDEDVIYIKTNDALKAELAKEGSVAWRYSKAKNTRDMGYWRLPDAALDDPDEAVRWGKRAFAVAREKAKAKPKKKSKK